VATQSYSINYAVGYASASWWCILGVTGATGNDSPDIDTTHWTLLAAQGSPGSQGAQGEHGLDGPRGLTGATGAGVTSSFYLQGTNDYSYDTTSSIYRTGPLSIGTGTASNSRFLVSSSGATVSLVVNEQGDTIFSGNTKISGQTFNVLPPGSINFGNKTSIYSPGDREIVIGTDNLSGYNYNYGWKFTDYQITNLWGNPIEVQNTMGTIGNLWIGSSYTIAGYGSPVSQQSTLFVKGTTSSIMKVVGIGATWSNSQSIFEINNSGAVSIGSSQSMSGSKLFIQSNTASTTIGSNVMLDLYNGQSTAVPNQVSELAFSADPGTLDPYNKGHRYAIISGYAVNWNNVNTGGGIKFSTRADTVTSLVTSLVIDPNGGVYNTSRGSSNTIYGYQALLTGTVSLNNTAFGYQSLYLNTIGENNTALGYLAGSLISGTTSGATNSSNSVFIGYDTRPQEDGQTNQIVVGYGATGNGSNSVTLGNNSITRTYLKGSVVIADGTQANGYILTSDSNGVTSWTASVKPVVETNTNYTLQNYDNGGIVIFTATASLTISTGLEDGFECTFVTLTGVALTVSPAVGVTLFNNTGFVLPPELSFTLKRRVAADQFITSGNL
jgi:hypothetical protein